MDNEKRIKPWPFLVGLSLFVLARTSMPAPAGASGLSAGPALGPRRVLAVLVDVPGKKAPLATREQVARAIFSGDGSVAAHYREISYGQVDFPGTVADVVGPFTVPEQGDFCKTGYLRLADAADAAAGAAGVDVSKYDHVAYVIPPDMPCWWTGLGIIGGKRVWAKEATARAFQHELGHNLGLNHALFWTNSFSEGSDFMGTSNFGLNAPHLVQLHWLDAFPGKVVGVESARTLTLETLEADPRASALPKIAVVRPSGASNVYYLSYRKATRSGPLSAEYTGGVNIHVFNGADRDSGYTRFVRSLSDGETYADGPMTIRQLSHAPGDRVRIRIELNGRGRARAAVPPAPDGAIQSISSGKCLDVSRGSKADGAAVIQYDCHAGLNQRWRVRPRGDDSYEIVNVNSGKCLRARGGEDAAGAPVVQWECTGQADQLWNSEAASTGQTLRGAGSGLCLDLPRASAANGVRPALWKCLGGPNQEWELPSSR
ncbi:MAG TPA: RICIN domain-containing protein [Elusimicrobiota bacterium]|nr:RICIN domain-containing protein [Elusimicrobiota bacterium]